MTSQRSGSNANIVQADTIYFSPGHLVMESARLLAMAVKSGIYSSAKVDPAVAQCFFPLSKIQQNLKRGMCFCPKNSMRLNQL